MRVQHDRGMRAVARVREVRERDSRIGLLSALSTVREREARLAALEEHLAAATAEKHGSLDSFAASRQLLAAMAATVREAQHRLDDARIVAAAAHDRWQSDKTRVRAIEQLLERRALRRAEERDRAEVRELDDIIGARRKPSTGEVA